MSKKSQNYDFVDFSHFCFFLIIFVFIKLPKAGSLCVKVTPLLVIFDVYLIRYMVISTAQLHSTKS